MSSNAPAPDRADPAAVEPSPAVIARELGGGGASFTGTADAPGHVVVTQQLDAGWRVENGGEVLAPFPGYGWAIAAPVQAGTMAVASRINGSAPSSSSCSRSCGSSPSG